MEGGGARGSGRFRLLIGGAGAAIGLQRSLGVTHVLALLVTLDQACVVSALGGKADTGEAEQHRDQQAGALKT